MEVINNKKVERLGERDASISIARCVAMCMIVTCHMLSYYKSELALWFNVGVQIFFVISGFLYGSRNISSPIDFVIRSFKKILIPYWLFLIIVVILYAIICPESLTLLAVIKAFSCSGTIDGLGHLWFVGYILFCYLLTPYLFWLRKYVERFSIKKSILIYCGILIAVQILGFLFDSYFEPDKVSCYILGFFMADLLGRLGTRQFIIIKYLVLLVALLMNATEVHIKYFAELSFSGWQDTFFRAFCRYSHLFLGAAIFLLFYGNFKCIQYNGLLRVSDRYSYPIYIVHQLFILSPLSLMSVTPHRPINWLIVLFSISVSGVFLFHFSRRLDSCLSSHCTPVIP